MSKHTPGPWSYDGHGINSAAETHKGERIFKTCLNYDHGSADRERAIADSNLVAAAPELLDSLGRVTRISHLINNHQHNNLPILPEQWSELSEACTEAIAVIAKADGFKIKWEKK